MQRYQGQPFAILGVNADHDRGKIKQLVAREGINWRSWWDGGDTGGPIAKRCGVQRWPSLFALDGQGIVRFAHVPEHQLEGAVEYLLQEMENQGERMKDFGRMKDEG